MIRFHRILPILIAFVSLLLHRDVYSCEIRSKNLENGEERCEKACRRDSDCISKKRDCLCDGVCGLSCVNKNLRCKGLNKTIRHGTAIIEGVNRFGAFAKYDCNDGYTLIGNPKRVCQGNARWGGIEPTCILRKSNNKRCGRLPPVHNGHHNAGDRQSSAEGTIVEYKCNKSFEPFSGKNDALPITQAWCIDGMWIGPKLTCLNAGCTKLRPIKNGSIQLSDTPTRSGTVAKYSCNLGFHIAGRSKRTCLPSGLWNGVEPSCEKATCRKPPSIPHANLMTGSRRRVYPAGTQLDYKCKGLNRPVPYNNGMPLRVMCEDSGQWKFLDVSRSCKPVECNRPPQVSHASYSPADPGRSYFHPMKVTYRCKRGYTIIGLPQMRCNENGKWSDSIPNCRPVVCDPLERPPHGDASDVAFSYGARILFSCKTGYKLYGSTVRECRANGEWSGKSVSCKLIDCGEPEQIYDGTMEGSETTIGQKFTFRCNIHSKFEGSSFETTCLSTGNWSHPTPKCYRHCSVISIPNATVNGLAYQKVNNGTIIKYKCKRGLVFDDPAPVQCKNGTWTHIPECIASPCQVPPQVMNARRIFLSRYHEARVKYICQPGYRLKGSEFLTCDYGKWIGQKPRCFEHFCPSPGVLENGRVNKKGHGGDFPFSRSIRTIEHGTQALYECKKGYERIGPAGATCVDGTWRPQHKPHCKATNHLPYIPKWEMYRIFT